MYVDGTLSDTDVVDVNLSVNSNVSVGAPAGYNYVSAPIFLGPWRFSASARYTGNFTPSKTWSVDSNTVSQFLVAGGLTNGILTDEAGGDNNATVTQGIEAASTSGLCSP